MDFVFDLLQGAGIAAAIGIRPFLPVLLVGALAAGDLGIDFDGTDFAFLEQAPLLRDRRAAARGLDLRRPPRGARARSSGRRGRYLLATFAVVHRALLFAAGAMADDGDEHRGRGRSSATLCAALGYVVARDLLTRVRKRLDARGRRRAHRSTPRAPGWPPPAPPCSSRRSPCS